MTTNTNSSLSQQLEAVEPPQSNQTTTTTISFGGIDFTCKTTRETTLGTTSVAYVTSQDKQGLNIKDIVESLDQGIANLLPDGLQNQPIKFKNLMVIYRKENQTTAKQWLFALDLDIGTKLKLKSLPVVGDLMPNAIAEAEIVPSLRIIATSKAFTIKEIRVFNDKIPKDNQGKAIIPLLPVPEQQVNGEETVFSLRKGFSFSGQLGLPDAPRILSLPVSPAEEGERELAPGGKEEEVTNSNLAVWFDLEKTFGPFSLKQIGFKYETQEGEGEIAIVIDAALNVSGLTLSCDDLGVGISLADLTPSFKISGIGIEYKSPVFELSGALLRADKVKDGVKYTEYLGLASLKFDLSGKTFGVSAIGAYAYYKGQPSLFLYAVLDFTLMLDPSFIITGFALGFGYNRYLRVPSIDKLTEFPLVAQAIGGSNSKFSEDSELITEQLSQMDKYMVVSIGSGFVAIGLKFNCFQMLDCFALLTIAFGEDFEINLLGIANMKIPTPAKDSKNVSCILNMTMLLRARFSLNEGVIAIEAQLASDCYILSPDCRVTGGFAAYLWFAGPHAGDFVITLGGYHPLFKKPAHYPKVPRLGFHWQVGDCLSLKGEKYFALCAHAIMAGGRLEANFRLGSLWANFVAEAHFLISWKPYYYDILVQVGIRAGYGILGPVTLGVQLHIWGPEFGGTATLKIVFVTVTMEFGDQSSRSPEPIDWESFQTSFLPPAATSESAVKGLPTGSDVCAVVVHQGITKQLSPATTTEVAYVVNPQELEVVVNSAIPTKRASYDNKSLSIGNANTNFGVRSMGIKNDQIDTTYNINIQRQKKGENGFVTVSQDEFQFIPVTQNLPSGLWGNANVIQVFGKEILVPPQPNEEQFVKNTLSGFRIVPQAKKDVSSTNSIDVDKLRHDTTPIDKVYAWQKMTAFSGVSADNQASRTDAIKNNIVSTNTSNSRKNLLQSLGFNPDNDVKLTDSVANSFVIAPQVKA